MKIKSNFSGLRSFLLLWASQSVSALGTAMTNYALVIYVHGQKGTASSLTLLNLCSFLPTILFRFFAGAVADRWNKKHIMLASDFVAACGTAAVFALYSANELTITRLCAINFLLSFMNAFQVPAAYVATSLLVPKEQYSRAGGLQAVSSAVVSILSPALGAFILTMGGMQAVLTIDLVSFSVAFLTLLLLRFPKMDYESIAKKESFWQNCLSGLRYLFQHSELLQLTLFMTAINFLAKMGGDGLMPAFILGRTNGNQASLSAVQASVAIGLLVGGSIVAVMKPSRDSVKMIFIMCGITCFTGDVLLSLLQGTLCWCLCAFISYLSAAVMNVHLNSVMRSNVPLELQGRVFSASDTVKNGAIPLGLYLGGVLADNIFEPLMAGGSAAQRVLSVIFGAGDGAGIAVMFFSVGIAGTVLSICYTRKKSLKKLNGVSSENPPQ